MWFIAAIMILAIVWAVCAVLSADWTDCPRVFIGHNCKGDKCDHSDEEWDAARRMR